MPRNLIKASDTTDKETNRARATVFQKKELDSRSRNGGNESGKGRWATELVTMLHRFSLFRK